MPGANARAETETRRERSELSASLERLADRPWRRETEEDAHGGFVHALFGGRGPSPKEDAKRYLDGLGEGAAEAVRADLEETLAAAWNVAANGKEAASALEPVPGDLRVLEAAITQSRRCRLVYAEALKLLAASGEGVTRDEVRLVKSRFNQAIKELSRTADLVSMQLAGDLNPSYAQNEISP